MFVRAKQRWLIVIGVLVIALVAWVYWARVVDSPLPLVPPTDSRLAPDFSLAFADGRTVSLNDWKGHIRLLNFWATWCVPCRQEMPEIAAAFQTYQAQGFVVFSINEMDDSDAVREFAQTFQLKFPVLLDSDGMVAKSYRVAGLPTSIFIDRDGVVRTVKVGVMDLEYIETQLLAMGLSATRQASSPAALGTAESDLAPVSTFTPTQPLVAPSGRLDLDALYPPGEGRDLVLEKCAGCHGIVPVAIVRRHPGGWAANRAAHEAQGLLTDLSAGQIDSMYRYLNEYRNRDIPRQKIPQELLIECDA